MDRIDAHVAGTIKPLVWTQKAPPAFDHEPFVYWAAGIGGYYRAEPDGMLWDAEDMFSWTQHPTQAAAKAAAEADYIARLRSQIAPVSVPEDVAGVMQRGNDLATWCEGAGVRDASEAASTLRELTDTIEAQAAEIARLKALSEPLYSRRKLEADLARLTERDKMLTEAGRDDRLDWFMRIMGHVARADSTDYRGNWVNAFCEDRGDSDDTFNIAIDRGLIRSWYDGDTDHGECEITDAGKAFVAALADASKG